MVSHNGLEKWERGNKYWQGEEVGDRGIKPNNFPTEAGPSVEG